MKLGGPEVSTANFSLTELYDGGKVCISLIIPRLHRYWPHAMEAAQVSSYESSAPVGMGFPVQFKFTGVGLHATG